MLSFRGYFTARSGNVRASISVVVTPVNDSNPLVKDPATAVGEVRVSSLTGSGKPREVSDSPQKYERTQVTSGLQPGETWDDTNWTSADDPGNTPGDPPGRPVDDGAGSGNFQLSVPVITLPGRGIDLTLNLNYNSRLWNKAGAQLTFDIDRGFPAPGWSFGFGKIVFMGQGGCMMIDADGTRHSYAGSLFNWSSGMRFSRHTTDGTFIDYKCQFTYGGGGFGGAKLANGTEILYSTIVAGSDHLYPTRIIDAQGNYISITYRPSKSQIETVTDTLGRVIFFHYDSQDRLISVSAPKMQDQDPRYGDGKTRIIVRLHYRQLALNYAFASGISPIVRNGTPWVIDAIYLPGTQTGYWFGDPDSYSSYGMLTKVVEQRGMAWSEGPDEQGVITPGTMTKQAVYNYPLTTRNEIGRTNGVSLTDAPTYDTLTEGWEGRDVSEDAVTRYKIEQNGNPRTTVVIHPNGAISKQYSHNTPNQFTDGLVFADETYIPDPDGTFSFPELDLTGNYKRIARSTVQWSMGSPASNYNSPRPQRAEIFDENGHKLSTDYFYETDKFNQVTRSCDYDNNGDLLKCSTAQFDNSAAYTGNFSETGVFLDGRNIFNLLTSTTIEKPGGVKVSRTDYEYDNYNVSSMEDTPGVVQHLASHNPYDVGQHTCNCHWACRSSGSAIGCGSDENLEWICEMCPNYDPATDKRGNITKITTYTDAENGTGAISETRSYDITGNTVSVSSSCCELTRILFDDPNTSWVDSQYAYPIIRARGAADPLSPIRITTKATYDFNTGLLTRSTDANGRTDQTWYNPDTLRPVKRGSSR